MFRKTLLPVPMMIIMKMTNLEFSIPMSFPATAQEATMNFCLDRLLGVSQYSKGYWRDNIGRRVHHTPSVQQDFDKYEVSTWKWELTLLKLT